MPEGLCIFSAVRASNRHDVGPRDIGKRRTSQRLTLPPSTRFINFRPAAPSPQGRDVIFLLADHSRRMRIQAIDTNQARMAQL